jgi:hypothetical protein
VETPAAGQSELPCGGGMPKAQRWHSTLMQEGDDGTSL